LNVGEEGFTRVPGSPTGGVGTAVSVAVVPVGVSAVTDPLGASPVADVPGAAPLEVWGAPAPLLSLVSK